MEFDLYGQHLWCVGKGLYMPKHVYVSVVILFILLKFIVLPHPTDHQSRCCFVLSGIFENDIMRIDISQAFFQAASLSKSDRFLVEVPTCLIMPWAGAINPTPPTKNMRDFVFLMANPLYGLHDSPLRRLISLATCLRRHGYYQRRTYICLFVFFQDQLPDTWIVAYVGDLLISYRGEKARGRFLKVISVFKTGEPEFLTRNSAIQFLGLDIARMATGEIQLSQRSFIEKLSGRNASDIFTNGELIDDKSKIQRFFKSALGELSWLLQIRVDPSYAIIQIATSITRAMVGSSLAASVIRSINRLLRRSKQFDVFISYGILPGFSRIKQKSDMCGLRLFSTHRRRFLHTSGRSVD